VKARTHVKAALLADEGVEPADFIQGNLDWLIAGITATTCAGFAYFYFKKLR
jgi:hypothetical protein